jgi:hypothetical protein
VSAPSLGETPDAERGSQDDAGREYPRDHPPTPRWLSIALIVTAAVVLSAWAYLALAHIDDRFRLDHVSGARMALAQYFDHGTLYPDLYDGEFYGGTRFMPLPIVLQGVAARLTGEYLVSGKGLSYVATLGLLATMVVLLRRLRSPFPLIVILPALVLTTNTGLSGSMNMRADVLPLLLQVLAVGIVANSARPAATIGAAAFASLALISKLSAVWAPIAIVVWLLIRDRKRLALFSGTYTFLSGALLLLFAGITGGRMTQNILGLSSSGITGPRSVLEAPYRFVHLMVADATAAWAVVPVAIFAAWIWVGECHASIYLISLLCATAVVLVILTDVGTGWNQLIDPVVLSGLVIGEFAARVQLGKTRFNDAAAWMTGTAIGVAVLWVTLTGFVVTLAPAVQATIAGEASDPRQPLSGVATSRTSLLSEDPYVPISLGQVPIVLDPFMLPRLAEQRPDAIPDLVRRIERKEFDLVILVEPLQPLDRPWWRELDLGLPIVHAIARAYTEAGTAGGYHLYEPRPARIDG